MTYVDALCRCRYHVRNVFVLSVTATVVLLGTLTAIERGTETYAVALFQIATFSVAAFGALGVMILCGRRESEGF